MTTKQIRYAIGTGNGNDGVSLMYPAFVVTAPEGSAAALARLQVIASRRASRPYLKANVECYDDFADDNRASASIRNPPRNPDWGDVNGSWYCVEVAPADDVQSDRSTAPDYMSAADAFGRQLVQSIAPELLKA